MLHASYHFTISTMRGTPGWATARCASMIRLLGDFLVEDLCLLCRKPTARTRGTARDGAKASAFENAAVRDDLLRPVNVPLLLTVFTNHPLCSRCAWRFQPARRPGVLGTVNPGGIVTTSAGERFGCPLLSISPAAVANEPAEYTINVIAPWMTTDHLLRLVHHFKYRSAGSLAALFSASIAAALTRFAHPVPRRTVLVPVPPSGRRRSRHTALLAAALGRELSLPVVADRLAKVRATPSQSRIPRHLRAQNVRNAFAAAGFDGKHVLVVDDVVTTGATAAACSAAIAGAGAASISILCFGRAL